MAVDARKYLNKEQRRLAELFGGVSLVKTPEGFTASFGLDVRGARQRGTFYQCNPMVAENVVSAGVAVRTLLESVEANIRVGFLLLYAPKGVEPVGEDGDYIGNQLLEAGYQEYSA